MQSKEFFYLALKTKLIFASTLVVTKINRAPCFKLLWKKVILVSEETFLLTVKEVKALIF